MKKLVLFVLSMTTAAVTFSAPKPKASLVFTVRGHTVHGPWATSNGRRIYYLQDTSHLFVYDGNPRKTAEVLSGRLGRAKDAKSFVEVSSAGDRVTFVRAGEDGSGPYLWTAALDT